MAHRARAWSGLSPDENNTYLPKPAPTTNAHDDTNAVGLLIVIVDPKSAPSLSLSLWSQGTRTGKNPNMGGIHGTATVIDPRA
jgi:hypothetical protein